MQRLDQLTKKVKALYDAKDPNRDTWADWIHDNHVLLVAKEAERLARLKHADAELAQAAALLHDVADVQMARLSEGHESASLDLARKLLQETGYADQEIATIVDDAIRFHSCHDGQRPKSSEGQILATADAVVHFTSDFYVHALWAMSSTNSLEDIKTWALQKIDKDLNVKICFDDVREQVRPDYERLKTLFSR